MNKYEEFKKNLFELSENKEDIAVTIREWELVSTNKLDDSLEAEKCFCGKETREIFRLKNKYTNNEITVGNKCINHFSKEVKGVYRGIKHLLDDPYNNKPNSALINYAYSKGFISPQRRKFLRDIRKLKFLSEAKVDRLIKLNDRLLYKLRFIKFCKFNKVYGRVDYLAYMVKRSSGAVFKPIIPKKFIGKKVTNEY